MDERIKGQVAGQGCWQFRTTLNVMCLSVAALGSSVLHSQDSPYVEAHKLDALALRNESVLVPTNRAVLPRTAELIQEAQPGTDSEKAVRSLDPAVETLLARMADAVPGASSVAAENSTASLSSEPGQPTLSDAATVESLLVRIAEALSSPPSRARGNDVKSAFPGSKTASPVVETAVLPAPTPVEWPRTDGVALAASNRGENTLAADISEQLMTASLDSRLIEPVLARMPNPALANAGASEKREGGLQSERAASLKRPPVESLPNAPGKATAAMPLPTRINSETVAETPGKSPSLEVTALDTRSAEIATPSPAVPLPLPTNTAVVAAPAEKPTRSLQKSPIQPKPAALAKRVPAAPAPLATNGRAAAQQRPKLPAPFGVKSLTGPETPRNPLPSPALLSKLRLNAIAAFGNRRAASINGKTVLLGEEAEFNIDGVSLNARCIAIKESSAVLRIVGMASPIELKVRQMRDK